MRNVPRAAGTASLYFHKEASPNYTRAVFLQTNLFPPKADSHGSDRMCVCVRVCAGGLLCGRARTSRAHADGIIVYFFNFRR